MKKLLLIPILILCFNSFSQDYVPFLDTNKMWIESYFNPGASSDPSIEQDNTSGFQAIYLERETDTSHYVQRQILTREYWVGFDNSPTWPYETDYTVQAPTTIGLLIEDTLEGIIYLNNTNQILYEFSLQVDDSVTIHFNSEPQHKIDSILTHNMLDGSEFSRYFFYDLLYSYRCPDYNVDNNQYDNRLYFDTRMGGNQGLTSPFAVLGGSTTDFCRACYAENEVLLWGDSIQCTAYLRHLEYGDLGINNIESKENSFSIYPNPVSSEMTVQFEEANQSGTIQVLSIEGKELLKQSFSNQNQVQLNLSEYNSGMYLIQFYSEENRKILIKRIIKN